MFEKAEEIRDYLKEQNNETTGQIAELLQMQEKLDLKMFERAGLAAYPEDHIKTALIVELGEFLNEMPSCFKYWKKTATDNREKALEELADCMHFALSLTNAITTRGAYEIAETIKLRIRGFRSLHMDALEATRQIVRGNDEPITRIIALGESMGFTWPEMYEAYKEKNKVNYDRIQAGY